MSYDTRITRKENTATHLVHKFLASEKSHEFNLIQLDLLILYTIARFLDMPSGKCFAKQKLLARECRTDVYQFSRRSSYLQKHGIISRYLIGKLYRHELGELLTGDEQ